MVLIVDDQPANLLALEAVLEETGAELVRADSGPEAVERAGREDFAAILLDVHMPGLDGLEAASLIRQGGRSRDAPILFITAIEADAQVAEQAYALGAVDFLTKPIHPSALRAKVAFFIELQNRRDALRKSQQEQARREAADLAAERVRQSDERYRVLFESMDEGFCVADLVFDDHGEVQDMHLVEANPAFARQTGIGSPAGRCVRDIHPAYPYEWLQAYASVVREGHPQRLLQHWPECDRWFDVGISRIGPQGSHRVGLLSSEVTERVQAEERLRNAAQALADSDRRKTEFLATLAHELRNPLAPLRNGLHVLRLSRDERARSRTWEMMERQLSHMVRLIDDLLDIARLSTGKIELRRRRVLLTQVVQTALESNHPALEQAGHSIDVRLPQEPVWLDVDPTRTSQIIGNLLSNAVKYTRPHGRIVLGAHTEGSELVLSVRDNGIGIAAENLALVFRMFTQVSRHDLYSPGGLGIGLALVEALARMHGGSITVDSEGVGRGSTFTLRLPVPQAPAQEDAAHHPSVEAVVGLNVLVVDDNTDAAESLALILQMDGHVARVAHDGVRALELARKFHPQVVFLDIGMPEMDGYEVARQLRQADPMRRPVLVALTGWNAHEDLARERAAGFDHHLTKPADLAAVERLLASLKVAA
jgi:signal transduction histidine kinase/DNA-binding response OmpR family regulator